MRPLELKVRNFRSYFGDGAVFDFRGRRLVGIVGPIGSGKSTILDAISYALYGRTPSIARGVKTLIHQRSDNAAVSLRFEVEGEIWEVVRSLRAKGASQHALYRLQSDDSEPEYLEKIMLEGEVNPRVEALLGLDFDAFGRSVLLAQGQFDEFLSARPSDRDRVLKGVFGYEKIDLMQAAAKNRVAALQIDAAKLATKLEQVETAKTRLAATRQELALVDDRLRELEKAADEISELDEQIAAAQNRIAAATKQLEDLTALEKRLPAPEAVAAATARVDEAIASRSALAAKLETVQEEYAAAQQELETLRSSGEEERIEEAGEIIAASTPARESLTKAERRCDEARRRRDATKAAIDEAQERLTAAQQAAEAAAAAAADAAAAAAAADAELHEARHSDMAAALRAELVAGEPCPVCAQPVAAAPDAAAAPDVARARAAAAEAASLAKEKADAAARSQADVAAAAEALVGARTSHEQAAATLSAEERAAAESAAAVAKLDARLAELLGPGDPVDNLASRRSQLRERVKALDTVNRRREEIREQHRRAVAAEHEAGAAMGELRTQIVSLAGRLDEAVDPGDTPAQFEAAADVLRTRWQDRVGETETAVAAADGEVRRRRSELRERLGELGVEGSFGEALGAMRARRSMLAESVERDATAIEEAAALAAEHESVQRRIDVFDRLSKDLTNSRFVRFLLDEERARLADLGSEHFERLSSGRYRFTQDFDVVDLTAADAVRKSESLSGGETFLASLGLALALAEMVTRSGGRLDAFFLDEGFGTLDPEHLDLAMEGIESLVAADEDRLVVVVSHVPELRHRIEDLIELDKSPVTGDTIVRRA